MGSTLGTAVITGASSILGMACAHHLANQGYDLMLVDRHRRQLNLHANDLTTRTGCAVEVCEADLRHASQRWLMIEKIRQDASISLVVRIDDEPAPRQSGDATADGASPHDVLTHAAAQDLARRCAGACIYRATVTVIAGTG